MRHQESLTSTPKTSLAGDELGGVALFFDIENILLGVQGEFVVNKVVEFLAERGEVMILRAYADWGRFRREQRQFLEAGVQMVFLPSFGTGDKNRTDTAICVDAMEILFTRPHIDTFAIVSGDSDFGVLANRLRDHGKRVVGISAKSAASQILVKQCHEFVFYETLVGQRVQGYSVEEGEARLRRALEKIVEDYGVEFRASLLKDLMRKQDPTFSERNYGAASFTRFLRNYDHVVTLVDGGVVRVGPDGDDEPPESASQPAGRKRQAQRPGLSPEAEAEARDVLTQAIAAAAAKRSPVRLSRLKDTMQSIAPEFDEMNLGFRTFTRFLQAFSDVVTVDRDNNTVTPIGGAPAPEADATPTDEVSSGRRRGGRSRGSKRRGGGDARPTDAEDAEDTEDAEDAEAGAGDGAETVEAEPTTDAPPASEPEAATATAAAAPAPEADAKPPAEDTSSALRRGGRSGAKKRKAADTKPGDDAAVSAASAAETTPPEPAADAKPASRSRAGSTKKAAKSGAKDAKAKDTKAKAAKARPKAKDATSET